jgi:hypothetical protein
MMCFSAALLVLTTATLSCAHGPCNAWTSLWGCRSKWALPQDPGVRCPNFYEAVPSRIGTDGGIFEFDDLLVQALQVATHDFFDDLTFCAAGRPVTKYRAIRQGDIVFIKIEGDPEKCGASYAIDATGKILHRHLGSSLFPADDKDGDDGGSDKGQPTSPSKIDVFEGDAPVALPEEFFARDAGTSPDAGIPR